VTSPKSAARGRRVAELLISEAWDANVESRYAQALATARRAELAAEELRDPGLVVRALYQQEWALRILGDLRAALVICARILKMAEDPRTRDAVADSQAARAICHAYQDSVHAARLLPGAQSVELLGGLDEADRWLTATGHANWRSGALLQRAELHSKLGEKQRALDIAQEALAAYDKDAPGYSIAYHHNCLGRTLANVGRHDEAAAHFRTALDGPRSSPYDRMMAHRHLVDSAVAQGKAGDAVRDADIAVSLGESCGNQATAFALTTRARAYRELERHDEAFADLDRAVELAPEDTGAVSHRAYLFQVLKRYDEALADLDRVLELDPGYAWALALRGYARDEVGRCAEALTDLDRALELDPGIAWAAARRDKIRQRGTA